MVGEIRGCTTRMPVSVSVSFFTSLRSVLLAGTLARKLRHCLPFAFHSSATAARRARSHLWRVHASRFLHGEIYLCHAFMGCWLWRKIYVGRNEVRVLVGEARRNDSSLMRLFVAFFVDLCTPVVLALIL